MFHTPCLAIIIVNRSFIIQDFNLSAQRYDELKGCLKVGVNLLNNLPPMLINSYQLLRQGANTGEDLTDSYFIEPLKKWVYISLQHADQGYIIYVHCMDGVREVVHFQSILNAQEEERTRIAEILHNEVGQLLAITHLQVDHHSNAQTKKMLKEAIKKVRSIAFELTPTILQDFGLEGAIKEMTTKKLESHQMAYRFYFKIHHGTLGKYIDIAIYRIVQELLNNIIKHALARNVDIQLYEERRRIVLRVVDDGQGINLVDYTAKENSGFGLKSIAKRVALLDGTFTIGKKGNNGTVAEIILPLKIIGKEAGPIFAS